MALEGPLDRDYFGEGFKYLSKAPRLMPLEKTLEDWDLIAPFRSFSCSLEANDEVEAGGKEV